MARRFEWNNPSRKIYYIFWSSMSGRANAAADKNAYGVDCMAWSWRRFRLISAATSTMARPNKTRIDFSERIQCWINIQTVDGYIYGWLSGWKGQLQTDSFSNILIAMRHIPTCVCVTYTCVRVRRIRNRHGTVHLIALLIISFEFSICIERRRCTWASYSWTSPI